MRDDAVDLVTIAREYGAGGSELARALGERLGWPVLDKDLPARVAARLKLDTRAVESMDEQAPTLLARLASAMLVYPPEAPTFVDTGELLSPDAVADAVRQELLLAAQEPPLVIVGHGGQCLLRARPRTLHVRLVAPLADRVARICGRAGCGARAAAAEVRRMDDERQAYIRRYHTAEWRDPLLYDLEVNTGRVPIAEAADLVARLVAARGGSTVPAGVAP